MEGLFSRSKYASYNKMCKREPPKASHTLFISPLKEIAVGYFQWVVVVHTGRVLVLFFPEHVRYEPGQRPVLSTV